MLKAIEHELITLPLSWGNMIRATHMKARRWQCCDAWSGRAPYLTGEWRWEGTLKEHCHVQPVQCDGCHDGHRYR
jgi:hypothetical protein